MRTGMDTYVPSSSSPAPEINNIGEILRFLNSLQTDNAVPTETACNMQYNKHLLIYSRESHAFIYQIITVYECEQFNKQSKMVLSCRCWILAVKCDEV